ncbi:hypothetical protein [Cellulomonas sp. PhB143]|uniref:hypothetical protein n=1 Tax=Cellulomonas sp. PhB143 TaxID=2485186 RepID=UPI0011CE4BA4|nr:hypothetical protein [Cellulomonas sp. PhB143]
MTLFNVGEDLDSDTAYVDSGIEDSAWQSLQDWQPGAIFDVLHLARLLGEQRPAGRMEFHSFAYLACLMSVFKGRPATEWGYAFSAVPPTLPYSPAIDSALDELIASGHLALRAPTQHQDASGFRITRSGAEELGFLSDLHAFGSRTQFLYASGATALFTSLSAVVNSLAFEPQLSQALVLDSSRMLLTRASADRLYEEFHALLEVLGPEHEELLVPASLYVQFLQDRAQRALDVASEGEEP